MMLDMVSLHLNHGAHRHKLCLPVGLSKADRSIPSIRHLFKELKDMVSDGSEQGQ
jgi:hypothetical protein